MYSFLEFFGFKIVFMFHVSFVGPQFRTHWVNSLQRLIHARSSSTLRSFQANWVSSLLLRSYLLVSFPFPSDFRLYWVQVPLYVFSPLVSFVPQFLLLLNNLFLFPVLLLVRLLVRFLILLLVLPVQ